MADLKIVDLMETVWISIVDLCAGFSDSDWNAKTDCPGWSVQDQISHMSGSESRLLGNDAPDHVAADVSHVKNDGGQRNEILVDWRRSWSGTDVLEEFKELTKQRLSYLRALSQEELEGTVETPNGSTTMLEQLNRRIYDAWAHEQDIRRALDKPGHLDGPVATHVLNRTLMAMPYVVGRKAKSEDGTVVVFNITGNTQGHISVEVVDGRAKKMDATPNTVTVALEMDFQTFLCLACGRWDGADTVLSGKVTIDGPLEVGTHIVQQMAIVT